jgi:hypothetical protein
LFEAANAMALETRPVKMVEPVGSEFVTGVLGLEHMEADYKQGVGNGDQRFVYPT